MSFSIRAARPSDGAAIQALLPRLAAFDIPARRQPEDLWRGDEKILRRWLKGMAPECYAQVALDADGTVVGAALVSLGPELLSGEASAHLEVLVVAAAAEGRGIGRALITAAENTVVEHGAKTMTLHVFAANARARRLYENLGYDGELIRYIRDLPDAS